MDRRTLMGWLVKGGGLLTAGILGVPAVLHALAPVFRRRSGPVWQAVGPMDSFPVGATTLAEVTIPRAARDDWSWSLRRKGVYVWRPAAGEVVVFARECTDLGCPVNFDAGSACFLCPCHGGIFAQDGERMAGPPRSALLRYATRVRGGRLEIDLNSVPPVA